MEAEHRPNTRSPSTTTRWKTVKIPAGPAPLDRAARRRRSAQPGQWDRWEPLTVTVKYRGGAECWYEIRARGQVWRVVGSDALHDVMQWIYAGRSFSE